MNITVLRIANKSTRISIRRNVHITYSNTSISMNIGVSMYICIRMNITLNMNMIIRVRKNISIHVSISIREELIRTCQSISVGILILKLLLPPPPLMYLPFWLSFL